MTEYPALSEEAQRQMVPWFQERWPELIKDSPLNEDDAINVLTLGTLLGGAESFGYLPSEERVKIFTMADWMLRLGYLLGAAPAETIKLLHSVEHLWENVEAPEWFKPLLEEYKRR